MKISVQTYTIRKLANEDLDLSLKQVKALGFKYLEVARIPFTNNNARIILDNGLEVLSIQVKYNILFRKIHQIISFCKYVGCKIVVVSVLPIKAILGGKKAIIKFGSNLNKLSEMYNSEGITLAFHHHHFEFKTLGKRTKFDYLLNSINDEVKIVCDTYWVRAVGIEPENFILYLGDRLIGLHLRDYEEIKKGHKIRYRDTEIGNGLIDFKKVLSVAMDNARYGAIEQNTKTPIKSLEVSLKTIKTIV